MGKISCGKLVTKEIARGAGDGCEDRTGVECGTGDDREAGRRARRGAGPGRGVNRGARAGRQDRVLYPQAHVDLRTADYVVCCVDDTDDVSGDTSTGYVAEQIAEQVAELGGCVRLGITRHQLLLAEGIPYTSHNSAMCFEAWVPHGAGEKLYTRAVEAIVRFSAQSADPGLCLAVITGAASLFAEDAPVSSGIGQTGISVACVPAQALDNRDDASLQVARDISALAGFGRRAQQLICTKDEAYALADSIPWLTLSEHGGTGQGIIGALAGLGLRLSGADGRFRGKWNLARLLGFEQQKSSVQDASVPAGVADVLRAGQGATLSAMDGAAAAVGGTGDVPLLCAGELCERMARLAGGEVAVVDGAGALIANSCPVALVAEAKPVLHAGRLTFVTDMRNGVAFPAEKVDLGAIGAGEAWDRVCSAFEPDNDSEECAPDMCQSCRNCLYRRWTPRGFTCVVS